MGLGVVGRSLLCNLFVWGVQGGKRDNVSRL